MTLVEKIKEKRELSDLPNEFVEKILSEVDPKLNDRARLKKTREKLRKIYGMFKIGENLEKNISAKTRDYKDLYKKIFSLTGKPKKIIELGCGLNGLSIKDFGFKTGYYGYDLSGKYCELSNNYFKTNKLDAECIQMDLSEINNFKKIPICDVVLCKRDISKDILKVLKCKYFVVSFSTKGLGGGVNIKKKQRVWFIRFLEELNLKFERFETRDELFYIVKING